MILSIRSLVLVVITGVCFAPAFLSAATAKLFPLVQDGKPVPIFVEPQAGAPVLRAAGDLAQDIASVAGLATLPPRAFPARAERCIIVGRLGTGGLIDRLNASGKLKANEVQGAWEASVRAVVPHPAAGIKEALVIAGSDVRGAIFALYDLSEEIGVSPWHWWADVPVRHNPKPSIAAERRVTASPSVPYRGIFINDEDWGLQPWAAKTFEPETGDIGPKTYAKVCELLLRLRANTLWPAMHACTAAFNSIPENRLVADRYGIVMGSSHAEPMLRNNVREWTADPKSFNYVLNREGVLDYWEKRLEENGRYENIYTLGMRGIHDSAMQGVKSADEQKEILERIFADQRELIAKHVNSNPSRVPQIFCAYKEVLSVYLKGLKVPDDVTIVWPDDNFGYIRNFASPTERARAGGCGIYYHISYLGRPLSYLWIETTPPALIWSEMSKAYDLGARKLWIVNVGDIKPAEIGMEFFLQMARDIKRWNASNLPEFLKTWAAREFGSEHAAAIARVMEEYYRLNFQRKPEHLQWWLPNQPQIPSHLTSEESARRLESFRSLSAEAQRIADLLPPSHASAFFELVLYPVRGSANANERFLCNEAYQKLKTSDPEAARVFAARSQAADRLLTEDTRFYNESLAGGKWRHLIMLEPADKQWKSMRIAPASVPQGDFGTAPELKAAPLPPTKKDPDASSFGESNGIISIEARHFAASTPVGGVRWELVPGLGRFGAAVSVQPVTAQPPGREEIEARSPRLDYHVSFDSAGDYTIHLLVLPTHPIVAGQAQRIAVGLDSAAPIIVEIPPHDGTPAWSRGVLESHRRISATLRVPAPGRTVLRFYGIDPGLVLDKILLFKGEPPTETFLGPAETAVVQ